MKFCTRQVCTSLRWAICNSLMKKRSIVELSSGYFVSRRSRSWERSGKLMIVLDGGGDQNWRTDSRVGFGERRRDMCRHVWVVGWLVFEVKRSEEEPIDFLTFYRFGEVVSCLTNSFQVPMNFPKMDIQPIWLGKHSLSNFFNSFELTGVFNSDRIVVVFHNPFS